MISIILYGKQELQLNSLQRWLENYIMMEDLDVKVYGIFFTPEDLFRELSRINKPIIYFLDEAPKKMLNVIELAELIRKEDSRGFVIFIASAPELAVKVINRQLEPMDFILKNEGMIEGVIKALNNAISWYGSHKNNQIKNLKVTVGKKKIIVLLENLIAVTRTEKSRKLMLYKTDGNIECTGQMKEIKILLDVNFYQIDRGCIINVKHIIGYDSELDAVIMINNQKYLVSQRCRSRVRSLAGCIMKVAVLFQK